MAEAPQQLAFGDDGHSVANLQMFLSAFKDTNGHPYYSGAIDGDYGSNTKRAVLLLQQRLIDGGYLKMERPNGVWDMQTQQALKDSGLLTPKPGFWYGVFHPSSWGKKPLTPETSPMVASLDAIFTPASDADDEGPEVYDESDVGPELEPKNSIAFARQQQHIRDAVMRATQDLPKPEQLSLVRVMLGHDAKVIEAVQASDLSDVEKKAFAKEVLNPTQDNARWILRVIGKVDAAQAAAMEHVGQAPMASVMMEHLREQVLQSTPRISPLLFDARVSSPYSLSRKNPVTGKIMPHYGADLARPYGQQHVDRRLVAPVSGYIFVDRNKAGAEGVKIILYGDDGNKYYLMHLKEGSVPANLPSDNVGTRVEIGQLLGEMGETGRATGLHLHYEVRYPAHQKHPKDKDDFVHEPPAAVYQGHDVAGVKSKTPTLHDDGATLTKGSILIANIHKPLTMPTAKKGDWLDGVAEFADRHHWGWLAARFQTPEQRQAAAVQYAERKLTKFHDLYLESEAPAPAKTPATAKPHHKHHTPPRSGQ